MHCAHTREKMRDITGKDAIPHLSICANFVLKKYKEIQKEIQSA